MDSSVPPLTIRELGANEEYCYMYFGGIDCTGRCRGIHVPKDQRKLCETFVTTGECAYGTDCFYQHRLPLDRIKYHPCHLIVQHPPSHSERLKDYILDMYGKEIMYHAIGRQHGKGKHHNHLLFLGLDSSSTPSTSSSSTSSSFASPIDSTSFTSSSSPSSFQPSFHPRVETIAKELDEAAFLSIALSRCYFVDAIVYEWQDVQRYFVQKLQSIVQDRRRRGTTSNTDEFSTIVTNDKDLRTVRIRGQCFPTTLSIQIAEELEFMRIPERPDTDTVVPSDSSAVSSSSTDTTDDIHRIYAVPSMAHWEVLLSIVAADGRYYICCVDNPDTHMFWSSREKHHQKDTVCRAQNKLREIIKRTDIFNDKSTGPRIAMDVGASPGGWSRVLATHPSCQYDKVYAIDPGALTNTIDLPLPSAIEHMPMKGIEAIQQLLNQPADNLRNQISCYTCDMNVPTRIVLDTLKIALPLLRKDAIIIVTLKNFDGKNNEWNKYVEENYKLFQSLCRNETTKLLHLISNGEEEVTIIGKYIGNEIN